MDKPIKQPITIHSVFNPTSEDLHFQYDSAKYLLKAGQSEDYTSVIANHAAKKLADRESITSSPEEHQVLRVAYLENSEPEVVAKTLGINLQAIRKEAEMKGKEKARMINLEATVADQAKKIDSLIRLAEAKNGQGTGTVVMESTNPEELSWPDLRRLAQEKGFYKPDMKKEDIIKELNK